MSFAWRRWLAALGLLLLAGSASAGCRISAAPGTLAFGAYRPLTFLSETASATVDSTAGMTVYCDHIVPIVGCLLGFVNNYSITVSAGASGSAANRAMPRTGGGSAPMQYNIFRNSQRTQVWGDGVTGTTEAGSISGCASKPHTFYGRVPSGQNALRAGSYTETLTVTLTFSP